MVEGEFFDRGQREKFLKDLGFEFYERRFSVEDWYSVLKELLIMTFSISSDDQNNNMYSDFAFNMNGQKENVLLIMRIL
ncbi:MAG: hypothetical protein MHPSP_000766 [Paramarteilia canceri]